MDVKELYSTIMKSPVDPEKTRQLEEAYGVRLPEIIEHIASLDQDNLFVEVEDQEMRLLSFDEILDFDGMLDLEPPDAYEFPANGLVPVVDMYDNYFVVYAIADGKWYHADIGDWNPEDIQENLFAEADTFVDAIAAAFEE